MIGDTWMPKEEMKKVILTCRLCGGKEHYFVPKGYKVRLRQKHDCNKCVSKIMGWKKKK